MTDTQKKMMRLTIRVPRRQAEAMEQLSYELGLPISELVRRAIDAFIDPVEEGE